MFDDLQQLLTRRALSMGVRSSDVDDVVGDCWLAIFQAEFDFSTQPNEQRAFVLQQLQWTVGKHWRRIYATKRHAEIVPLDDAIEPYHTLTPDRISDARSSLRSAIQAGGLLALRPDISRAQRCRLRKRLQSYGPLPA